MTTLTFPGTPTSYEALPARPNRFTRYVRETGLLVGRGLRTIPRVPSRLSDVTIQPVVFTLLFLYVFGSAIHITGMSYQNYLLPGLIGQSLAFGVIGAGVATAGDFTSTPGALAAPCRLRARQATPLSSARLGRR